MLKIISQSEKQTKLLAQKMAASLKGGEVLALIGELGAGKTFFIQCLGQSLGVKEKITSPTFILFRTYKTNHPKIKTIHHFDAYRLKRTNDLVALGALEFFGRKQDLAVIEWADKIKSILPKKTTFIKIKIIRGGKARELIIKGPTGLLGKLLLKK
jgi:tRNA threonylcarbamoyladenosine biosynthesis protein TsaE